MLSKTLLVVFTFVCAFGVNAQDTSATGSATTEAGPPGAVPTGTANIPPCVLTCTSQAAAQAGCQSISNVTCVCTSQPFQAASLQCIMAQCDSQSQQAAGALQSSICGGSGAPPGGAPSGAPPGAPSGPAVPSGSAPPSVPVPSATPPSISSPLSTPSSVSAPAASAPAPTSAASMLIPSGFGAAHVVGAAGIILALVGGATTLF